MKQVIPNTYLSFADNCAPRTVYPARGIGFEPYDTVVVNIPNANGSYTPVAFRRDKGFYAGPRGEYYATMPTVEQLEAVYGLK